MGAGASAQIDGSGMSETCKVFCRLFSPMAAKDGNGKVARVQGWMAIDPNGNGHVSLAEADGWLQKCLVNYFAPDKDEAIRVWKCFRPSYIRAFNDAKDLSKKAGGSHGEDYVQKVEFRGLISYFCLYAVMYDAFALIDGGGGDVDNKAGDDRRMTLEEWKAGASKVANHGFAGLKAACEGDLDAVFKVMNSGRDDAGKDAGKDNVVMLTEFCKFVEDKEVALGTVWGKLLNAGE
jgi:hypothetical protein